MSLTRNVGTKWGGAITIDKGILFIQGYTLFDGNYAEDQGNVVVVVLYIFRMQVSNFVEVSILETMQQRIMVVHCL